MTESQLIDLEEMMELENFYFVILIITDLGKNHQCILKLVRRNLRSNRTVT